MIEIMRSFPPPCVPPPRALAGCWLALLAAAGCGSSGPGPAGFPATPLLTASSASGALTLEVFSDPQPPVRGNVPVRFRFTDAAGHPVDGLTLAVVPWMPAMGHGSSVVPTVTALGEGRYDLANLYLFMPGQWELRTTISGGASDTAAPALPVQ
jgi:hypothetical protein